MAVAAEFEMYAVDRLVAAASDEEPPALNWDEAVAASAVSA